jgi:putative NIF3 family GTP cyclohydrolase 1 type 2
MGISIRSVIEAIRLPSGAAERTVDGLLTGNPGGEAKGIAVTFLASREVLEKAAALGANLVISHEGIFYSHWWERREALSADPVYQAKCKTLEERGLAVYRHHDAMHRRAPDEIIEGLLDALDWKRHETKALRAASVVELPETTLDEVIGHIKSKLGIRYIRFAGDGALRCRRVGLLPGYCGTGEQAIPLIAREGLDLVVYGEGPEWETPEYVRDALFQGRNLGLAALGHAESESPGMERFARKLRGMFPEIPVHFIGHGPAFKLK